MAEIYKFFDGAPGDTRVYSANDYSSYFEKGFANGIYREADGRQGLKPWLTGADLIVRIATGSAMIKGYQYQNTSVLPITLAAPHGSESRIDTVVLRLDLSPTERWIKVKVITGTPAFEPIAPPITRNALIHELLLAHVEVPPAVIAVPANNIKDFRLDKNSCGVVTNRTDTGYLNLDTYNMIVDEIDDKGEPITISYLTTEGATYRKTMASNPDTLGNYQTVLVHDYLDSGVIGRTIRWELTYTGSGVITSKTWEEVPI